MEILKQQTFHFGETELTYLAEGFLVNPSQMPANKKEMQIADFYLKKCLEQFMKLSPNGLWQKMFVGLLQKNLEKFTTKFKHRWRIVGTSSSLYSFQLLRLEQPTKDIEFGLLPTPMAADYKRAIVNFDKSTEYLKKHQHSLHEILLHNGILESEVVECYANVMGYPSDWTKKPFQSVNGEKNQSKHLGTQ